jgi:hypothetical protein
LEFLKRKKQKETTEGPVVSFFIANCFA